MPEESKIRELIKKHVKFFEEMNAEVAISNTGRKFFYYVEKPKEKEFFSAYEFRTAEDLEKIILSEIAFQIGEMIDIGIKGINHDLEQNRIEISYENCEYSSSIQNLTDTLKSIQAEFHLWQKRAKNILDGFAKYMSENTDKKGG